MATKKTPAAKTVKKAAPAKKPAAKKAAASAAKKAVAVKKTSPAKAKAAKKAVSSGPVKKAVSKKAMPVSKKTAARKAVPAKKAAPAKTVKKAPVKAVKKAAPAKKTVAGKVATSKKIAPKKAAAVRKAPARPVKAPVKKAPARKAAPSGAAVKAKAAKVAAPATKMPRKPEVKAKQKETPAAVKVNKPAPKKVVVKQQPSNAPAPAPKSDILDAVRPLPRKTVSKPGQVIAMRKIEKPEPKEEHELTMKEYNPTSRSVLDSPEQNTGPVYRYNDEDLNEFKELILQRLENARKELTYLQGLITRKDEAGTEDTDNRFNHMEDGSGAMEREQLSQLAGRQIQFIGHLENALVRIENKTYGICRVTGHLIDKARLRAVPHATLSIEAKNSLKK